MMPVSSKLSLTVVGIAETPWKTLESCPKNGWLNKSLSTIKIFPEYRACLTGLKSDMHLFVIWWCSEATRDLQVGYPNDSKAAVGVFAMRSPFRINPLAISRVVVEKADRNSIIVRGLEALNGSPIIDIKKIVRGPRGIVL